MRSSFATALLFLLSLSALSWAYPLASAPDLENDGKGDEHEKTKGPFRIIQRAA
jgi:hypothetical protein